MKKEIWKPVHGYEGLYEVSNTGLVRSLIKCGTILSPAKTKEGYLKVFLYSNKIGANKRVHRLVAEAFIPNRIEISNK